MLITFEGIDGSGKSTQAQLLVERLEEEGHKALLVRDPGGTVLSERIRELLLGTEDEGLRIDVIAEVLLFSAARAQLVEERIRPALEEGRIVVCDRFYDSTTAYQAAGRDVDPEWVKTLSLHITGGLVPARTFLVDLPARVAFKRLERGRADRMERTGDGFYERVARAYRELAAAEERFRVIDGDRPVAAIHEEIWADVQALLPSEATG